MYLYIFTAAGFGEKIRNDVIENVNVSVRWTRIDGEVGIFGDGRDTYVADLLSSRLNVTD